MRSRSAFRGLLALSVVAATGLVASPAQAALPDWVTISNGTVMLGVWNTGELNVPADLPQTGDIGTTSVGLRYVPTGYESTADGCLCEGWGAADATSGLTGYANQASGSSGNLTVESFTATASSAVSTVNIDGKLRVTHDYHPSATPNLYEVTVTLENLTSATIAPRYRRVMDWDVQPSAFSEYTTIQGTSGATDVLFASDDGFASSDPLSGNTSLLFTGDAVDSGPADHGALFDFGFDPIAAGGSHTFKTYYGAAGNEVGANAALATVGAEVYSYGQPSQAADGSPLDPTVGNPNTFIFAFGGVGGTPVFPAVSFSAATYSAGEGAGSATITATLSTAAAEAVTVNYATSDGTATAGSDYTAASGTLTFPAGSTSQTFTVPIIDDSADEPDETVNLTLSSPSGGGTVLGAQSTAVLTIVDNDEPAPAAHVTSTTWTGGTSVQYSDPVTLSATLTDTTADPDAPVPGRTMAFTLGSQSATGTTNAAGSASTSMTVTQAPGSVTSTSAAFAGDASFLASSATSPFAITKEDCTLAYTGATAGTAGGTLTLSAALGELDTSLGDRSGKAITFSIDNGTTTSTVSATTDASGVATTSTSLPEGVYVVATEFAGDAYYLGCSDGGDIVVVSSAATKVTGGGFIVDDGRVSFGFKAKPTATGFDGQLQVRAGKSKFHGDAVTTLTTTATTATWSGTGRWNGTAGYTFTVSVVDAPKSTGKPAKDQIRITITAPGGSTVLDVSGALKGGNITVH